VPPYLALTITWPEGRDDELSEILSDTEALGAHCVDASGGMVATIFFDASHVEETSRLAGRLESIAGRRAVIRRHDERDWLERYRDTVRPFEVAERWWIDPHPEAPTPAPDGRTRLAVEQRSAFGSGSHESTRLVLEAMEKERLAGRAVLDVGTGSGILAVAAAAAGAAPVVALDIDPQAIWVARTTVRRHPWEPRPQLIAGPLAAVGRGRFDVVLCNMLFTEFAPLLPDLRRLMGSSGRLVLSGLLEAELSEVAKLCGHLGLKVIHRRTAAEWASVTAEASFVG